MTIQSLEESSVFQFYQQKARDFWKSNPKSCQISESVWPNLTGDTLIGEGKINYRGDSMYLIEEKFLTDFEDIESVKSDERNCGYTFLHLGPLLTGHEGIIHGGLLATLLDELTCRVAFQNFHSKRAVTANLNINYLKPCWADSYVLVKCAVLSKKGRKCYARGEIYHVNVGDSVGDFLDVETKENLLTEAVLLAVEPRWMNPENPNSENPKDSRGSNANSENSENSTN